MKPDRTQPPAAAKKARKSTTWRQRWRDSFEPLATRRDRLMAAIDLYLFDHGALRALYPNAAEIAPGVIRRSQVSPRDIRRHARNGVKTILNLRGPQRGGHYFLEREACTAAGIKLVNLKLSPRFLPSPAAALRLADLIEHAPRPLVIHCKSGSDRTGLAAGFFALLVQKATPETAARALSLRFLHVRRSAAGVLDLLFQDYARFCRANPIPFRDWLQHHYDPVALTAGFHDNSLATFINDRILRRE